MQSRSDLAFALPVAFLALVVAIVLACLSPARPYRLSLRERMEDLEERVAELEEQVRRSKQPPRNPGPPQTLEPRLP